ncbi:MAG: pilus assembly protein [candidate division Zixibacteria bacterium]|nr:pilus assembly protein [candidate division Zixibacteria bacterium]
MVHRFVRIRNDSRGNAVIEFALVLPILLLVLFGITEFGRAIMTKNILHTASREGARLAAVSPVSDTLSVQGRVIEILDAARVDVKEITIVYNAATRSIQVTVTNDFQVLSAGVLESFIGVFELRGVTSMRYEG